MRTSLAFLGVFLVALATLVQMIVDWYQSEAQGIPMPDVLRVLVVAATVMTLAAVWLGFKGQRTRR